MRALREVWGSELTRIGNDNDRVVLVDGDMANSTRADIFAEAHPERFLQFGIAEQNLVGAAVGLAGEGFVPWLSSFTVFFTHRALDPVRMLVAQTGANVKIAGAYAGLLTGLTGRTHQDVEDIAILRAMPNMTVLSPADPIECEAMTRWATDYVGPVYMRLARDPWPDVFSAESYGDFIPGAIRVVRRGGDIVIVSTGVQTARVVEASELLARDGVEATVIHVGSIKPLDSEALSSELRDARFVFTAEEHSIIGGLGGLVAETMATSGRLAPLVRIGIDDVWTESASNDFLLDKHGLSATRVAETIASRVAG